MLQLGISDGFDRVILVGEEFEGIQFPRFCVDGNLREAALRKP